MTNQSIANFVKWCVNQNLNYKLTGDNTLVLDYDVINNWETRYIPPSNNVILATQIVSNKESNKIQTLIIGHEVS
jgi:hypothetical protein